MIDSWLYLATSLFAAICIFVLARINRRERRLNREAHEEVLRELRKHRTSDERYGDGRD